MKTRELAGVLDAILDTAAVNDYSDNGLQVEAATEAKRVAFAVDASLSTFEKAAALRADFLIVHHGLFWGKAEMLTGYMGERVRFLFEKGISLYAVHLPLDAHPVLGNSAALVTAAGGKTASWFCRERGVSLGCLGRMPAGETWGSLLARLEGVFGGPPVAVVGAPEREYPVGTIGVVTGGGMRYALEAAELGADVYISGEPSHSWYHPVLESNIPCILYGHYATETLGLKRLQEDIAAFHGLETVFIDNPTSM